VPIKQRILVIQINSPQQLDV